MSDKVIQVIVKKPAPIHVTLTKTGPAGAVSGKADAHYEVPFTDLSTLVVQHNLGKKPAVTVIDSANTEIECEVVHNDNDSLTIYSSAQFSGMVVLN